MSDMNMDILDEQEVDNDVKRAPKGAPGTESAEGVTFESPEDAHANAIKQVPLPEDKKQEITTWLFDEIARAKADRSELDERIVEWTRLYEAKPENDQKSFPWEGASNIVVPVVATAVDAVLARLMGAVFGGKHLWEPSAKSAKWGDLIDPLGVWLNWVGDNVLNMYKVVQNWFLGMMKHGTGITKLVWERRFRRVVYMEGDSETEEIVLVHDGPRAYNIPLSGFFMSSDAVTTQDIQNCTWVAHRRFYTWKELKELEFSGYIEDVDRIKNEKRSAPEPYEEQAQEASGVSVSDYNDWEVWEIWASYDIKEDGIPSEIVVLFQPDSRVMLSGVYNYFRHQERPFHATPYMPRDDSFFGIGIPEMLKDIQDEITTMHNQRIDNATLANTKAFKRRRTSMVGQDEIYPGAFIDVDEMDDIAELELGTTHPTMLQEEMHTNSIGEKRTGVSDYTVGRESSAIGSRATATSTMALLREGNKRFQMTIRSIRVALSDMAHQTIMLYQQFAPDQEVMYEMFSDEEGRVMKQFMQLPTEYSRANVIVETPALSEVDNKEMKQQTMLTLLGVTQQFYTSIFEALQIATSPEAPQPMKELASHAAKTGSKLFERILESFEFRDADSFAPNIEELLQMQGFMEQMGGMANGINGQGPGGAGAAPGGQPQMAGLGGAGQAPAGAAPQGPPSNGGGAENLL